MLSLLQKGIRAMTPTAKGGSTSGHSRRHQQQQQQQQQQREGRDKTTSGVNNGFTEDSESDDGGVAVVVVASRGKGDINNSGGGDATTTICNNRNGVVENPPPPLDGTRKKNVSDDINDDDDDDNNKVNTMEDSNVHNNNNKKKKDNDEVDHRNVLTAVTSSSSTTTEELWHILDRQLRVNIGTSVKCGICLSTMTNPVRTPCNHTFCKDCLLASLHVRAACPECNNTNNVTKRSISDFPYINDMANAYKDLLEVFGWVPGQYDESFTTLTQKVVVDVVKKSSSYRVGTTTNTATNDDSDDDDDDDEDDRDTDQGRLERLCVATTWQNTVFSNINNNNNNEKVGADESKNSTVINSHLPPITSLQIEENRKVVEANWRAVTETGVDVTSMLGNLVGSMDCSNPVTTKEKVKTEVQPTMETTTNMTLLLPATQDVQEQFREQEAADQELFNDDHDNQANGDDNDGSIKKGSPNGTNNEDIIKDSETMQMMITTTMDESQLYATATQDGDNQTMTMETANEEMDEDKVLSPSSQYRHGKDFVPSTSTRDALNMDDTVNSTDNTNKYNRNKAATTSTTDEDWPVPNGGEEDKEGVGNYESSELKLDRDKDYDDNTPKSKSVRGKTIGRMVDSKSLLSTSILRTCNSQLESDLTFATTTTGPSSSPPQFAKSDKTKPVRRTLKSYASRDRDSSSGSTAASSRAASTTAASSAASGNDDSATITTATTDVNNTVTKTTSSSTKHTPNTTPMTVGDHDKSPQQDDDDGEQPTYSAPFDTSMELSPIHHVASQVDNLEVARRASSNRSGRDGMVPSAKEQRLTTTDRDRNNDDDDDDFVFRGRRSRKNDPSISRKIINNNDRTSTDVTGMMEDSMGVLHMYHHSVLKDMPENSPTLDQDTRDGETLMYDVSIMNNSNSNNNNDLIEKDDDNEGREEVNVQTYKTSDAVDVEDKEVKDSDSDRTHEIDEQDDSNPIGSVEGLRTYDPRRASETTDETHAFTKRAIADVATRPAGIMKNKAKPAKKNLFKDATKAVDDSAETRLLATSSSRKGGAVRKNADRIPNVVVGNSSREQDTSDTGEKPKARKELTRKEPSRDRREGNDGSKESKSDSNQWTVGTVVNVQSRTWPGVNKHGGVGRITAVNEDDTYNIAYVLGGKELNVDAIFIEKEDNDGSDDHDGPKSTAAVAARRKRRNTYDDGTLPEELLRQLAEEGFDTGIAVPSRKVVKRKQSSSSGALADSTNSRKGKTAKKSVASFGKKRGSPSNSAPSVSLLEEDRNSDPTTTTVAKRPSKSTKSTEIGSKKRRIVTPNSTTSLKEDKDTGAPKITDKAMPDGNNASVDQNEAHDSEMIDPDIDLSSEEACRLADTWYRERFQAALDDKTIYVLTSNLSGEDTALVRSLTGRTLDGQVKLKSTETINKKTTLCVVPSDEEIDNAGNVRPASRTIKVMRSALLGIPMVTPEWLLRCEVEGRAVHPSNFVRSLPTKAKEFEDSGQADYGVAKLSAAWLTRPIAPALPFRDIFVFLCGNYNTDVRKHLVDLLKDGGAKILPGPTDLSALLSRSANSSSKHSKIVILCSDTGVSIPKGLERELKSALQNTDLKETVSFVDSKWVFESITCAKALPALSFEPTGIKDLWKMSR